MNKRISFLLFVFLLAGAGMGWLATAAHAAPTAPPPTTRSEWLGINDQWINGTIRDISCPATGECVAVTNGGHLLIQDGGAWSVLDISSPYALYGVSCASTEFCLAVGHGGFMVRWNGEAWLSGFRGAIQWEAVDCLSSSFCMAADGAGNMALWNGASWATFMGVFPLGYGANEVRCPTTNFCVAVANNGHIRHWDGASWGNPTSPTANGLSGLDCPTPTLCMAGSNLGELFLWNGTAWSLSEDRGSMPWFAVACPAPNDCTAVSTNGDIHQWNGTTWATLPSPTSQGLFALSCVSVSECTAVGINGTVLHYNGSWSALSDSGGHDYQFLNCLSEDHCLALTLNSNRLGTWDGTGWSVTAPITTGFLANDLSCPTSTFCVTVGTDSHFFGNGVIGVWDGTNWTWQTDAQQDVYRTVSCASPTFCVVLDAYDATARYWNGTMWSGPIVASWATSDVECLTSTFCAAVGGSGDISIWDGTTWTYATSPTSNDLGEIDCPTMNFCAAVADMANEVVLFDGTNWITTYYNTPNTADGSYDIGCASPSHCVALGEANRIEWDGTTWTTEEFLVIGVGAATADTVACTADHTCLISGSFTQRSIPFSEYIAPAVVLDMVWGDCVTAVEIFQTIGNHPNATFPLLTGTYWSITPTLRGGCSEPFSANLTLPYHNSDANDKVCRYTGVDMVWDCARYSFASASSVTRLGISQFSDWAVGNDAGPTAVAMKQMHTAEIGTPQLAWLVVGLVLFTTLFLKKSYGANNAQN